MLSWDDPLNNDVLSTYLLYMYYDSLLYNIVIQRFHELDINHIHGVMVSVLASSVIDRGFEPRLLFWHITTVQMSSSEWVSDCFLRQLSNFSAISWREQVNFQWDDDEICFVLDQRAELDFYSASSLKQQSAGRHVAPFGHIILRNENKLNLSKQKIFVCYLEMIL
jgi:hypothetical protein